MLYVCSNTPPTAEIPGLVMTHLEGAKVVEAGSEAVVMASKHMVVASSDQC